MSSLCEAPLEEAIIALRVIAQERAVDTVRMNFSYEGTELCGVELDISANFVKLGLKDNT